MNCPYCNTELNEGLIQSARDIFWGKDKHKIFFFPSGEDEFMLSGPSLGSINGATVAASYCPDCQKIIIDLS